MATTALARLFPARGVTVARVPDPAPQVAVVPAPQNAVVTTSRELAEVLRLDAYETDSGAHVTPDLAMRTAAVFSCVRVLSEDIAALPLNVYRWLARGKERADSHWLAALLRRPNAWQTGYEFREMQQAHVELCGNFFALKTVVRGEVRELLPLSPDRVSVRLDRYRLYYTVSLDDGTTLTDVPAERMYHARGLTVDGIRGVSPIAYQRETVGVAIQQLKYGARLYKNGAQIGGMLEHPASLSDEAYARLKDSFDEQYAGVANAHKTILLEEGTKYQKTGMSAEEAQWLEARKFTRAEIAGIYRVPPHMIADMEKATFANIEQQSTDYVINGLVPRLRRLEARMGLALLSESEQTTHFVEHLVEGRLRGDNDSRMKGYMTAVSTGWMTPNEVRERENLPLGPAKLDEFLTPAFLVGKTPPPAPPAAA